MYNIFCESKNELCRCFIFDFSFSSLVKGSNWLYVTVIHVKNLHTIKTEKKNKIVKMKVQRMQDRMLWRITQTCFTDKSSADFYDIKRIICSNKNCIKHVFRSVCVCVCVFLYSDLFSCILWLHSRMKSKHHWNTLNGIVSESKYHSKCK